MKKIAEYVDKIKEELCGAKDYAEMYVQFKSDGDTAWASKFKGMAEDELRHSMLIHDLAVAEIDKVGKVFTAPAEMQEAWEKSHKDYVEKSAWVKMMLTM